MRENWKMLRGNFHRVQLFAPLGWHGFRGSQRWNPYSETAEFFLLSLVRSNNLKWFSNVWDRDERFEFWSEFGSFLASSYWTSHLSASLNPENSVIFVDFVKFLKFLAQQKISLFLTSTSVMLHHCFFRFELMELRPDECLRDSILEFQCIVSLYLSSRCSWKSKCQNSDTFWYQLSKFV